MYEEQDFDFDTMDKTQKNKKYIKIIIVAVVVVALIIVSILFFTLYNGNDENESSAISGILSEEATSSKENTDISQETNDKNSSELSEELSSELSEELSEDLSDETSEESSEEVSEEPDHRWVKNSMGYTYLYQGKGYNQFNGTQSYADKYATALNGFTSSVSFPVYSMIAPTSVEFVDIPASIRREDDFFNSSQKVFINNVNGALNATPVDIYSSIASKVNDEYLYLRTDKNWTADAAYLAYLEFCTATGNIAAAKTGYELGSYTGYLGNFYNATGSGKLKANADTVNYYKINSVFPCVVNMYNGELVYKDRALIYTQLSNPISYGYYAFLGDRGERFTITSQNSATEKTLLVVGDASAFAFVPYLVANYRTIYFINADAYSGSVSSFIADKNIDEAVVLSYASSAATNSYINRLNTIFAANTES